MSSIYVRGNVKTSELCQAIRQADTRCWSNFNFHVVSYLFPQDWNVHTRYKLCSSSICIYIGSSCKWLQSLGCVCSKLGVDIILKPRFPFSLKGLICQIAQHVACTLHFCPWTMLSKAFGVNMLSSAENLDFYLFLLWLWLHIFGNNY